jgi:AbiV family abortive infection protein
MQILARNGSHEPYRPIDLEAVKLLFRKCLDNVEALLDSAKDSRAKKRNHIAFHLAVLALEEIGKAAMLLGHRAYPHVVEDAELDESKLSDQVADHRKKLFWAMLTPNFNGGVFTPEDFIELKEIANDIHFRRIASLYANVDQALPEADISDYKP